MRVSTRSRLVVTGAASSLLLAAFGVATGGASPAAASSSVRVMRPVASGTSVPVADLKPRPANSSGTKEREVRRLATRFGSTKADPATQATAAGPAVGGALLNVAGLGQDDNAFTVNSFPPDTNAAVGTTYLVQAVNTQFGVYRKSDGARVAPPFFGSQLFGSLAGTPGATCGQYDDGDPVVQYDRVRDRFILTQFQVEVTPTLECVAVSRTADPLGAYDVYAFSYGNDFPDYPKIGIWPDAYYATYNVYDFNTLAYKHGEICALDLNAVTKRASRPVTQQCFDTGPEGGGMLPADLDGSAAPPKGNADEYGIALLTTTSVGVWRQHTDWTRPDRSTLSGPFEVTVDAFGLPCGNAWYCVPQPKTGQLLDSLGDRPMYRLGYRNLGGKQSLVTTQSVAGLAAGRKVGAALRWYEFVASGQSVVVAQQGTYTPDTTNRWMGSAAMNKTGAIAIGYSASSSDVYPAIRWTGRLAGDPPGQLRPESEIQAGGGSQGYSGVGGYHAGRWGDYSSMTLDPTDDCTFWFTTEYLQSDGVFNWSTRIAKLRLPGC